MTIKNITSFNLLWQLDKYFGLLKTFSARNDCTRRFIVDKHNPPYTKPTKHINTYHTISCALHESAPNNKTSFITWSNNEEEVATREHSAILLCFACYTLCVTTIQHAIRLEHMCALFCCNIWHQYNKTLLYMDVLLLWSTCFVPCTVKPSNVMAAQKRRGEKNAHTHPVCKSTTKNSRQQRTFHALL